MKFDAYAVLAKLRGEGGGSATPATCATQHPNIRHHVAQVARVARRKMSDCENPQHPAPIDTCRTSRTCRTGQVIPWPGRGYHPEAICKGVAKAFADYEAQNDPHDPRAWR